MSHPEAFAGAARAPTDAAPLSWASSRPRVAAHETGRLGLISYYYFGGQRLALAVNGTFSYLGSDGQGSATVAVDSSGNVQANVLYGQYGTVRYSSGTMPGSYGSPR